MTASLTINLSADVLKALKAAKSITVALGPGDGPAASRATPAKRGRPAGKSGRGPGGFREGSLPAKLVSWASGRKRPFGVGDVIKALKVKRAHASMVLTKVLGSGSVERVGRGEYRAG